MLDRFVGRTSDTLNCIAAVALAVEIERREGAREEVGRALPGESAVGVLLQLVDRRAGSEPARENFDVQPQRQLTVAHEPHSTSVDGQRCCTPTPSTLIVAGFGLFS